MKIFGAISIFIILSVLVVGQANADVTIYLLRHAEKQSDGTNDPHLTERGELRAAYLSQQLSLTNITKIFSSNYKRTLETAKPLSELLGITVELYDPRKLEKFAEALRKETGQIMIVGHSNTTPQLTALLSGVEVDAMDESEYENMYQVVLIGNKARLNRFRIFPIGE